MIVITGPTGQIGSQLLAGMIDGQEPIRVIARHPARLSANVRDRVEVIPGSYAEREVVMKAFDGADAVFWLPVGDPAAANAETAFVQMSRPAAEAIARHGIRHVVSVSALGRGWPKDAGHATASIHMDDMLAATGAAFRALACPSLMDNILRQAAWIAGQGVFYAPSPGDFLFLDESGDLGFTQGSTPVFAISILHLKSASALQRAIKRARKRSLGRRAPPNEFKWSASSPKVRLAVLQQIVREAHMISGVSACVVEKGWINPTFAKRREEVRYNYAVRLALERGGLFDPSTQGRRLQLTIDARSRRATQTLAEYVDLLSGEELQCSLVVASEDSAGSPQLQAADFVAGSVFSAYAQSDWRYMNFLRDSGVPVELRLLKKKQPAP
jgi:hypothetical protein